MLVAVINHFVSLFHVHVRLCSLMSAKLVVYVFRSYVVFLKIFLHVCMCLFSMPFCFPTLTRKLSFFFFWFNIKSKREKKINNLQSICSTFHNSFINTSYNVIWAFFFFDFNLFTLESIYKQEREVLFGLTRISRVRTVLLWMNVLLRVIYLRNKIFNKISLIV